MNPLTYDQAKELITPFYQFLGAAAALLVVGAAWYIIIWPLIKKIR